MPDGSVPLLIAIIALVILSAFFSSTETAYSCVNKIKLRSLASNGNKLAKKVLALAEDKYDSLLSTILVGNNIVNITATTLATIFFAMIIADGNTANIVSTAVMTVGVLIFGEITPKLIAKTYPEKLAMAYYPIIIFFYYLLFIFNKVFEGWKWLLSKIFKMENNDVVTEEEIMTMVEEAEEDGTIRKDETNLIRSVIEFDDVEVGDILVPRVNIVGVDREDSLDTIKETFDNEGYSRLPVYKGSIDTIIGTIHEKDFFSLYLSGKKDVASIIQPAFFTTEHVKISKLLKQMQKSRLHIAVVLDEYGGTLGMVTLEDILEELVGEIWDEHDEEVNYYKALNKTTFLVDGNAPLGDTFEYFSLGGEDENFESVSVSGWVIEMLGEIPVVGRKFSYLNLDMEVMKSTVKKVIQIKVIVRPTTTEDEN
ncbi:MAG: HlyC/CorC family transporter [Clostridiales bacterium]|nr:HlyC/CorC family transporter [Clostridiales bacterium]